MTVSSSGTRALGDYTGDAHGEACYHCPDESVTLQIWDTAGQERFSSLSAAFFRGADAALLMFDVNQPESLDALHRWWAEFCERAPLLDEEMEDFCCVVVGNKVDVSETLDGPAVNEADALSVINELVPPSSPPSTPPIPLSRPDTAALPHPVLATRDDESELPEIIFPPLTSSITIGARHHKQPSKSRSRSSHFRFPNGTMTTTHTTLTSYHTPSSSYFDVFESARSSPRPPFVLPQPLSF
ncbi:hypothetical protein EW146_g8587 [Bondarzewia mesenterica]|uniref:Uncharacterized protein n=1 Tax=Bondarzewia mesenterica TaxID=1095465 RepID=A0A4S4LIS6_9AGAM|nr:hypothetical protein EW146_g8587 [Bondarzewia mesenterica]